ncbi:NUDIX hydrolase [Falsarthrobacter nasiphocae]|uniref:8-oxo-dGTP diphosphatase n=1 Tax=Falsarthrobacter nasiphocae TaxID=189863 RepID=A0AAE3YHY7_9MICC|nr:NUDIX domain-containing protein [Falsarthrobacter nasiphocae]MDR6892489.1 8-oxo-dGTP diphosphatase [Falsarthrobacter nasiphocae]
MAAAEAPGRARSSTAVYPQTHGVHVRTGKEDVIAAGGLLWREDGRRLQVLVIHRPRYDDWSWPKGKLDQGESLPECAVREISEEVGVRARLGIPLPSIHYRVNAGEKAVYYWAVEAGDRSPRPDGSEVDRAVWMTPDEARAALTNPDDVAPLDYLEAAHAAGRLRTSPLLVARHAKAKPRSKWTRPEGDRPLAPSGFRQAEALAGLLQCWRPERVASSPWTRCTQTMQPYIKRAAPKVKLVDAFTERAATENPDRTALKFAKLLTAKRIAVYCGHRPVMPVVLGVLRRAAEGDAALSLPDSDPYLRPAALIVAHVSAARPGRVVAFEVHEPFDD